MMQGKFSTLSLPEDNGSMPTKSAAQISSWAQFPPFEFF